MINKNPDSISAFLSLDKTKEYKCELPCYSDVYFDILSGGKAGQSVSIPRHSQTRTKHADLVTLET